MTRVSPPQNSFSAGELSPLLHWRFDYARYQTGLRECRGFLPLRQGGFTRAPGTVFRGYTRDNGAARLVSFEFAADDAVTLEFTANRMRVWRYGALVQSGGAPYELATPYNAASLERLQWVQSADVIYLVDGFFPVHKLSRLALNNWTLTELALSTGPFRALNSDEGFTIQASGETGNVTLTASQPLFDFGHVGSLMLLQPTDWSTVPLWSSDTDLDVGARIRSDGKVYELVEGTETGVNRPVHERGVEQTETDPVVKWRYICDQVGIARITSIVSPTQVSAAVQRRIPQGCVDNPTWLWAEGAWSGVYGHPSAIELYQQRLVLAATRSEPRTVWFSTVGDFADFQPSIEPDESFAYAIAGEGSINRILWLRRGRAGLHIGALGEEYSTRNSGPSDVVSATTTEFGFDSAIGSAAIRPLAPLGDPIFVSRDRRRLMQIAYSLQSDANRPLELSLPAEHIGASEFLELAQQAYPQRLIWCRLGTGDLAAMLYDPDEEVLGWAVVPHAGGVVESMAVASSPDGRADVMTMVVRREIGGQTVRMIEEQSVTFGAVSNVRAIAEANHLFAASILAPVPDTDTFSLPHLAGEQVHAWTDKGGFGPLTVAGNGALVLPEPVGRAAIGLFDDTHVAETLPIVATARDGSPLARAKRLHADTGIAVHGTAGGRIAAVERELGRAARVHTPIDIIRRDIAMDLTEAFSGVVTSPAQTGQAAEVSLRITPVGGAPLTVAALVPTIEEHGA